MVSIIVATLSGLAVGLAMGLWLMHRFGHGAWRERVRTAELQLAEKAEANRLIETQLNRERERCETFCARLAALEQQLVAERKASQEKLAIIDNARSALSDAFKALAADALKHNSQSFMELATSALGRYQESARGDLEKRQQAIDSMVRPMRDTFQQFEQSVKQLEQNRAGAYQGLREQIGMLLETQRELRGKTQDLVKALGTPRIRGRWGEIQLKRVVELAGMVSYCDFFEQSSVDGDDGRLRPDLVVRLPGGKNIVIDAKAPLSAYLEAMESTDETIRSEKLLHHARLIREHITALGRKSYWEHLQPAPEFVVLFLPGESFFSAALQADPSLIEHGIEKQGVIPATPTTLIALLKAVAYGWRQERLARNAEQISVLGRDLYKRIVTLKDHVGQVGSALGRATEAYNRAVASLESRVLVTARRFDELGAGDGNLEDTLPPVDAMPRQMQTPEMTDGEGEEEKK